MNPLDAATAEAGTLIDEALPGPELGAALAERDPMVTVAVVGLVGSMAAGYVKHLSWIRHSQHRVVPIVRSSVRSVDPDEMAVLWSWYLAAANADLELAARIAHRWTERTPHLVGLTAAAFLDDIEDAFRRSHALSN